MESGCLLLFFVVVDESHGLPQDKVPLSEKLDQIVTWIDLPLEQRPQFISGLQLAAGC
jgi:hypothetical protein